MPAVCRELQRTRSRNSLDPTEAVIRGKGEGERGEGKGGYGSFQPLAYLIITASVEWGAFLDTADMFGDTTSLEKRDERK